MFFDFLLIEGGMLFLIHGLHGSSSFGESKINNFTLSVFIDDNIFEFEVPMDDILGVYIGEPLYNVENDLIILMMLYVIVVVFIPGLHVFLNTILT